MRRFTLLFAAVLLGCGSTTGPSETISGNWSGTFAAGQAIGTPLTLTLAQNGATVSGTGFLGSGSNGLALTSAGTFSSPTVSLTLTFGGLTPPVAFTGTVSGKSMAASLTGSGFNGDILTMSRP